MTKIAFITSQPGKGVLPSIIVALGLISVLVSTPVSAAKFGVKIIDDSGKAVSGAAVCASMPGSSAQFAALVTDKSGLAMLEVPHAPFQLTVYKSGVGVVTLDEPARGFNLVKRITLKPGTSRATCHVKDLATLESSVRIAIVEVIDDTYGLTLKPQVSGEPTEYRVSRSSSFSGVKWQRFDTSIPLSASLSAEDEVYVQMRRYMGVDKSWIEARSDILNVKLAAYE